jgi:hypothetical protein
MSELSRRTFLRGVGVSAAAVTATAAIPATARAATRKPETGDDPAAADAVTDSLVVYVKDARVGEISVMSGDREVVVTDRRLAQRLARLAD